MSMSVGKIADNHFFDNGRIQLHDLSQAMQLTVRTISY